MDFTFFPIFSSLIFENKGQKYDGSGVLDPKTKTLDINKYKEYSPPFLATIVYAKKIKANNMNAFSTAYSRLLHEPIQTNRFLNLEIL